MPPWVDDDDWIVRFDAGETEHNPPPETREIRNMLHLVAYDIACPKRLRRVAKTCEAYGVRIEKSVFECDLPEGDFDALWCALIDEIDEEDDAVVAYRICADCLRKTESMGAVPRPDKPICYVI